MLTEIKKQFFEDVIKKLGGINSVLGREIVGGDEHIRIAEEIFYVSHQLSGTGPMLGFDNTSKLSKKLEKTFNDIRLGQKEITPQILWQTKRAIEAMIKTLQQENGDSVFESNSQQ